MATKNYMINDKWLDLDKQNIVELQSVDGVLDSMKVNGSEIVTPSGKITITENGTNINVAQYATADVNVEGGGGSSDWTKAIVRVKNNSSEDLLNVKLDTLENDGFISAFLFKATIGVDANAESIIYEANTDKTDTYYIYKNAYIILYSLSIADPEAFQVEGHAEILAIPEAPPFIKVTGDCTITIS